MPKMKTKRSAAKRFKVTASGKVKIKHPGLRHLLTKKSANANRNKRKTGYVHGSDVILVKAALPYAF
ncbi:MAG: 50S ribosomal protein L35 [Bacteriovoracaceae bacterium]|nr:50S ribosomal protein L35 [Bacteriovoracaceae bacterium]